MNVCIIGWYGSETLGDRAILDGIMCILGANKKNCNILLGSLYPFFSERTVYEDSVLYSSHGAKMNLQIFDVYNKSVLRQKIKSSDMLIMGGGPLMDIDQMYILQHSFKYAQRHNVMTALIGCGFGPLKRKEYLKATINIANNSDLIVMRSEKCKEKMYNLCGDTIKNKTFSAFDPAMISVINYKKESIYTKNTNTESDVWSMNIRDLDYVYNTGTLYFERILKIVRSVAEQVAHLKLMPMHSFYVGGDDRYIENLIAQKLQMKQIEIVQKPPSLEESYQLFLKSTGCIGMRYHSIVFQTYLNGNNYLLDYTDSKTGKIVHFLSSIDKLEFYKNRYINIKETDDVLILQPSCKEYFSYDLSSADENISYYNKLISEAFKGRVK